MNIGELSIQLSMDLARLKQDMDQTKRVVSDAMQGVEKYAGLAKTALAALTGVAGVGAFYSLISGAIEARSKLVDLSVQTGLTVEQLSSLQRVTRYSGTQLDDVAAASNKLNKVLATTTEGGGGAALAMSALGLSLRDFKQLAPDEQLLKLARAMSGFADGTGKAVAAQLLLEESGAKLLPFFKDLAERGLMTAEVTTQAAAAAKRYEDNLTALQEAGNQWKVQMVTGIVPALVEVTTALTDARQAYGNWFSALDLAGTVGQGPAGKQINDVNEQLGLLRKSLQEAARTKPEDDIFSFYRPTLSAEKLQAAIDRLIDRKRYLQAQQARDALQEAAGTVDERRFQKPALNITLPPKASKPPADTYTPFATTLDRRLLEMQSELDMQRKLTPAEKERVEGMAKLTDGTVRATAAQEAYARSRLDYLVQLSREVAAEEAELKFQEQARQETQQFIDTQARQLEGLRATTQALALQADEYGLTVDQLQALNSARLRATASDLRARQLLDEASPSIAQLNQLYRSQADELERIAAARDRQAAREARDAANPLLGADRAVQLYLADVARAGDATQRAVETATRSLEDTLTTFFSRGRLDVRSFVDTLIAEFVRLRVVRPLLSDLLGNGVGGGAGGTGGLLGQFVRLFDSRNVSGGYTGNTTGPVDGFAGNFATGGYIPPGQWGMTGEAGPEPVFGGRTGATVLPNKALAAAGPVVQQTVHNHIDARSDLAVVEQIARNATQQGLQQFYAQLRADGRL